MASITEIIIEKAMRAIAAALAAGRLKTIASGVGNIPAQGPALIVARHYHHLYDGLALFAALPRSFHIVVTVDWAKNRRIKFFMETLTRMARWPVLLRADALRRDGKRVDQLCSRQELQRYQIRALRQAAELLVEGKIVVVFPEGYPNIDPTYTPKSAPDEFLPFKPGFVSVLTAAEKHLKRKVPIIPAGLCYTSGKPWVGRLNFGKMHYRVDFADSTQMILCLEAEVKSLSAPGGSDLFASAEE